MKSNVWWRVFIAPCLVVMLLVFCIGSAQASIQDQPKDICANKLNGYVRTSSYSQCSSNENSLGLNALEPGLVRPNKLDRQLAARFNAARVRAKANGFELLITSGWRSVRHQQLMFERAVVKYGSANEARRWVLPADESLHTWGLAIDIRFANHSGPALRWFKKYSYRFGLCRVYKNEWWHFEPNISPGQKCSALR